jgi:hypothetical protein
VLLFIACLALLLLTLHIALLLLHTRYSPHPPLCCCYSLFTFIFHLVLLLLAC